MLIFTPFTIKLRFLGAEFGFRNGVTLVIDLI